VFRIHQNGSKAWVPPLAGRKEQWENVIAVLDVAEPVAAIDLYQEVSSDLKLPTKKPRGLTKHFGRLYLQVLLVGLLNFELS